MTNFNSFKSLNDQQKDPLTKKQATTQLKQRLSKALQQNLIRRKKARE